MYVLQFLVSFTASLLALFTYSFIVQRYNAMMLHKAKQRVIEILRQAQQAESHDDLAN